MASTLLAFSGFFTTRHSEYRKRKKTNKQRMKKGKPVSVSLKKILGEIIKHS